MSVSASTPAAANRRWKNRPEGSTWGDFGADDQLGRINLLTARKVIEGAAEVKAGRAFCLSLPLDVPGEAVLNPRRHPPKLRPTEMNGEPYINHGLKHLDPRFSDVICDDQVQICLQYSTQWDSLAHVGSWFDADGDGEPEMVYYNGYRAHDDIIGPGDLKLAQCGCGLGGSYAMKLGIENMAAHPIQGRGVLVDLRAHLGDARTLVDLASLQRIMVADRVTVEPGDMLLLHTGFADVLLSMDKKPDKARLDQSCAALDGRDPQLLQWITDSGISALIADNYAVEAHPAREFAGDGARPSLPLHEHCLFKLGLPLGELWWLGDLAAWLRKEGRSRFLLTAPPLRLPGAVGSPATPVATV